MDEPLTAPQILGTIQRFVDELAREFSGPDRIRIHPDTWAEMLETVPEEFYGIKQAAVNQRFRGMDVELDDTLPLGEAELVYRRAPYGKPRLP